MDDALPVRGVERVGDLRGDLDGLAKRQRAARQALGQRLAGEVLHDEVVDRDLRRDSGFGTRDSAVTPFRCHGLDTR